MTCLLTGVRLRKRGVSRALAGANVIREELHSGTEGVFANAGFTEVSRPTPRRVVMRIDF